ncbi:spore cortex-lytic protein [Brevibacillus laterosporus]|uniref:cell wall hydrolase n=1 Tax=Brevibacillus TaxID=55080 RepID=UPI000BC750C7|nr:MULTISPECIES: cell wall hydrolase [Brevibacillus]AUM65603.1 spore cortex-lytic protein [Brevibacillus laterosporus]MBA4534468.1 cell wall hydrolase [Brevibacillus halotolerans]PCN44736.1 spore cortex-lytic protein [Brevibacillus laterosporus]
MQSIRTLPLIRMALHISLLASVSAIAFFFTPAGVAAPAIQPVSANKTEKQAASLAFAPQQSPANVEVVEEVQADSNQKNIQKTQAKLQKAGLYQGPIDGRSSEQLGQAVAAFQRLKGLPVTGLLNEETFARLQKSNSISAEIDMLERLVYAESRGEPYDGKVAVAAVVLNRVKSEQFPDTIKGVIFARNAFSVIQNGRLSSAKNKETQLAVRDALFGDDPSRGALYFYNPDISTSRWIFSRTTTVVIDNHVFAV